MSHKKLDEHESRILCYVTGLLFYYGVMDFVGLYRAVRENLEVSPDLYEFRFILEREIMNLDSPFDFDADEDYYFHLDVEDVDRVLKEQGARKELPYRPVSEKEARLVVDGQYFSLWGSAVKRLFRSLQEEYGWTEEEALDMVLDSQEMLRNGVAPTEVVKDLLDRMNFSGLDEVQPFMDKVMEMTNHTPLWILKGWTPHEVFERLEKDTSKPLSDTPIEMKKKESTAKKESMRVGKNLWPTPKVGRNEPCPCGSGKKFKKCCGPPVNEGKGGQLVSTPLFQKDAPQVGGQAGQSGQDAQAAQASHGREPTREEWIALYEAADAFKKSRCWKWMYNDDLFGVMDPETEEIAYSCIMGNLGEHYGLAAYLGTEGLESALNMLSVPEDEDLLEQFFNQKCLMTSFLDREELTDEDRAVIKDLGLKFRGKNQWPQFCSYEPGLFPWFIDDWECRFLTLVLQQSLEVALRCREDKSILGHRGPRTYLVRVPGEHAGGQFTWEDRYLEIPSQEKEHVSVEITDELFLRKILTHLHKGQGKGQRQGIWEADTFWFPFPVQEQKKERPYYPKVFLIVDLSAGLIIRHELMKNLQEDGHRCVEAVLQLVGNEDMVPSGIFVERDETYYLLTKACQQLELPLEKVGRLQLIPRIKEEMLDGNL